MKLILLEVMKSGHVVMREKDSLILGSQAMRIGIQGCQADDCGNGYENKQRKTYRIINHVDKEFH